MPKRFPAVRRQPHLVPLGREELADDPANIGIVIDDENPGSTSRHLFL